MHGTLYVTYIKTEGRTRYNSKASQKGCWFFEGLILFFCYSVPLTKCHETSYIAPALHSSAASAVRRAQHGSSAPVFLRPPAFSQKLSHQKYFTNDQ